MEKKSVLIVDDDCLSRQVLRTALQEYEWIGEITEASDMAGACAIVSENVTDLIFLDIKLQDESALDSLDALRRDAGENTCIVFYTAYQKYLMQALRRGAFDFLLKPIDAEELRLILNRYLHESENQEYAGPCHCHTRREVCDGKYAVPVSAGISMTTLTNDRLILSPRDIVFFRYDSERKFWEAVLTSMQHLILKRNTTADTILNYGPDFVRTHKSYIVNVAYIGMISGNECHLIAPFDRLADIRISKIYRRQLLDRFYDL